ncbi:MAG: M3 family oligoendopeptidase [Anaerolineales bacterium]|nr:M3 family oligoendopeptidase [Anaerolineales bacterium]
MMTQTYQQTRWKLSDLFEASDSPDMQAAFSDLERMVTEFEARRAQLTPDIAAAVFLEIIRQLEQINCLAYRIDGFASLQFSADTQDQIAQTFLARVQQTMAGLENRSLFFSLWWKDLAEEAAERLMQESGDYRYWLEEMRHFKPHTLSEAEEKVINIKNTTGSRALHNLYDAITNRYVFKLSVDGEQKELTRGEIMVYVRHPDPALRAAAYQEIYRVYGQDGPILGQIYQTLVRDWRNEQVDMRRFGIPISARNLVNDIPDEVVDTLLEVCKRNAPVFQRYFRLKAQLLGLERLRRYDLYAPVTMAGKTYEFGEAVEMVMEAFYDFAPRLSDLARRVLKESHLDSEVRKGKRSGAFCATITPDLTPWVLLNYQGRPNDVATMAHELGHAIHALLANHHSLFTQHACLPMAETASTFGEMMLVDRLLAEEQDENVRRDMLFRQVDDAYATIMRQAFFALFERQAHDLISRGASIDDLSAAYMQNLEDQFGDAIELNDDFRWEWVSVPHIYQVPFYVYAYAFGQLLVLSLYQQYKEEGEAFKPRYLEILAAGGSEAPAKILAQAGVDIYSADFWQGGFDVIARLVDQLEALPTV